MQDKVALKAGGMAFNCTGCSLPAGIVEKSLIKRKEKSVVTLVNKKDVRKPGIVKATISLNLSFVIHILIFFVLTVVIKMKYNQSGKVIAMVVGLWLSKRYIFQFIVRNNT